MSKMIEHDNGTVEVFYTEKDFISDDAVLGEVRAVIEEIVKRIHEDKNKLKTIKAQIHGHIRIELIVKEVLRDYENGEHFA